jgi:hypothetical protein
MLPTRLHFMVREMTKKHLAAINRGRKAAGLKPIRMKKKTTTKKKLPKIVPKNEMDYAKTKNEFYREYKRLGGKKSKAKYTTLLNKFFDHTMDIFVHGDPSRYKSRNLALNGFRKAAKIDNKEVDRIFSSVDNVHAYT